MHGSECRFIWDCCDDVLRTLLETAADGLKNYVNAFFELIISRDLNLVEINISLILRA